MPAVIASVVLVVAISALVYFFLVVRRKRESADSSSTDGKKLFTHSNVDAVPSYSMFGTDADTVIRNTKIYDDRLKYDGWNVGAQATDNKSGVNSNTRPTFGFDLYGDGNGNAQHMNNPAFRKKANHTGDVLYDSTTSDSLHYENNPGYGKVKGARLDGSDDYPFDSVNRPSGALDFAMYAPRDTMQTRRKYMNMDNPTFGVHVDVDSGVTKGVDDKNLLMMDPHGSRDASMVFSSTYGIPLSEPESYVTMDNPTFGMHVDRTLMKPNIEKRDDDYSSGVHPSSRSASMAFATSYGLPDSAPEAYMAMTNPARLSAQASNPPIAINATTVTDHEEDSSQLPATFHSNYLVFSESSTDQDWAGLESDEVK